MVESTSIDVSQVIMVAMLGMFILAIGVTFFFLVYQKRLLKQQNEHQQKEAQYQQQLLRANLQSQEKERNRIGKDLHDEVGAMLTTSKLYFRHLEHDAPKEKFKALKDKVFDLLEGTIASVRRVSHDLRPVVLETLGLEEAVANIRDQLNASGEVHMSFESDWKGVMNKEYQLNWYRIIQELVNNTLKHAKANQVVIHMSGNGDGLKLSYTDNGIGMASGQHEPGLGLSNIESRLSLMNGELVFNETEKGISLELTSGTTKDIQEDD